MTIRKQFTLIDIGTWNGNMLSFEFRTYLQNATLLSSNDATITITMNKRTFHLQIDNQINLTLIPQLRFAFFFLFICRCEKKFIIQSNMR